MLSKQPELFELGKIAISDDSPCGNSVRYEDEFQKLEAEISKLEALNGDPVDWSLVFELSKRILADQSKDLLVAVYLAQGLLRVDGIAGLSVGLNVIRQMVEIYWSDMFPPIKRIRARNSAFQWLSEQAEFALKDVSVDSSNAPDFISASEAFEKLSDTLDGVANGEAPSMLEMHKLLKESKRAASEYVKDMAPVIENGENQASESVSTSAPAKNIENQSKQNKVVGDEQPLPSKPEENLTSLKPSKNEVQSEDVISVIANHPLIDIGRNSISDESKCGIAIKYEPDFEALEAELAKQESVTASAVDWPQVCLLASGILKSQSKDLLVCSYFSKGLLETEGYIGLTLALSIMKDMIDIYWEDLFPPKKRLRARESALQWLSEKTGQYISDNPPSDADTDAIIESADLISDIQDLLDQKVEGGGPSLLEISRPLRDFKKAAKHAREEAKKKQSQVAASVAESKSVQPESSSASQTPEIKQAPAPKKSAKSVPTSSAKASSISVGMPSTENEAKRALRAVQEAARTLGTFWLETKLSDPKSYRINRISTWVIIEACPPANEGLTQLATIPTADKKKMFQSLFEAENYIELIPQLEQTLARTPFWLDGQYLVTKALEALGKDYTAALETVVREMRVFLERVPGVEMLKFSDGTPFANEETLLWIHSEVMVSASNSDEGETPWSEIFQDAKILMSSGKMSEAVALFESGITKSESDRLNWQWRFALTQLLLQTGKIDSALPILRQLLMELDAANLLKWEAKLAKNVAIELFNSAKSLLSKNKQNSIFIEAKEYAYNKLCLIDPITAITLQEGK